jgi:ribosomal protein S18 acetylase RimI-like enzyme
MAGFCNYRFVVEDDWVVLYVYELQVSEKHRRKGLGKGLLQLAEALAKETAMDGVCLTALKGNIPAMKFYQKLEYVAASFDPSVMFPQDADKFGYVIFTKLHPQT